MYMLMLMLMSMIVQPPIDPPASGALGIGILKAPEGGQQPIYRPYTA